MDILCIVHDTSAPAGLLAEAVARRGGTCHEIMPELGEPLPAGPEGFDGLVVLGGPMDADDDAGYPHFRPLLALMRACHAAGTPIMGVCLGAQLLARAFGADITRLRTPEIGFTEITMTRAAARDPLLKGLPRTVHLMQWHQDTFALPAGAVRLMGSALCPNQAFRLGEATYGFQFHLEATKSIVRTWVRLNAHFLAAHRPGFAAEMEAQLARHWPGQAAFTAAVADRWLDRVAARRRRAASPCAPSADGGPGAPAGVEAPLSFSP